MPSITITAVSFTSVPSGTTQVTLRFRKLGTTEWFYLNGAVPVSVPSTGILTTPIVITGLPAGTTYEISSLIIACNGSEVIRLVTTPGTAPTPPVPPTTPPVYPPLPTPEPIPGEFNCAPVEGITISKITTTTAMVSWTPLAGATNYEVKLNTGAYINVGNVTNTNLTGMLPGSANTVYVRAVNVALFCKPGMLNFNTVSLEIGSFTFQNDTDGVTGLTVSPMYNGATFPVLPGDTTVGTMKDFSGEVQLTIHGESCNVLLYRNNNLLVNKTIYDTYTNDLGYFDFTKNDNIKIVITNLFQIPPEA
jgi:hypothetical protein